MLLFQEQANNTEIVTETVETDRDCVIHVLTTTLGVISHHSSTAGPLSYMSPE